MPDACSAVLRTAASIKPTEHAAFKTLKTGSTMPIMMSKPLPSAPSMAARGIRTSACVDGRRVIPAQSQALERTVNRDPARPGGDQPDRARSFSLQRL